MKSQLEGGFGAPGKAVDVFPWKSIQPATLQTAEKKAQCHWWLLPISASEVWFLTNQGNLQSHALFSLPVFSGMLQTAWLLM